MSTLDPKEPYKCRVTINNVSLYAEHLIYGLNDAKVYDTHPGNTFEGCKKAVTYIKYVSTKKSFISKITKLMK